MLFYYNGGRIPSITGFNKARNSKESNIPPIGRVAAITYEIATASSPATSQLPYPKSRTNEMIIK